MYVGQSGTLVKLVPCQDNDSRQASLMSNRVADMRTKAQTQSYTEVFPGETNVTISLAFEGFFSVCRKARLCVWKVSRQPN